MNSELIEVIDPGCGKVAFYYEFDGIGRPLSANRAWYPNGEAPNPGEGIKCGSCGRRARMLKPPSHG